MHRLTARFALFLVIAVIMSCSLAIPATSAGLVRVVGNSLQDDNGSFVGLGFTWMAGLWMCKYDRAGFQSECSYMSQRGFNYMRILSEVPAADAQDYWWGRSINASTYQCPHGSWAYEWPDYDQQFRDMVDIAYDQYGIRTEVTIFGGAGDSFPTYAGRQAHCQRILNLIAGREHKIIFMEVGNEAWQTGFPWPQGLTDLRNLCAYLTARTSVPVAITSSFGENNEDSELYNGSTADIATAHFSRDIWTFEGGWLPVRDCWRIEDAVGVPPCSSDEPIGPGSSVAQETDPIKLVSAACFAYIAKLPCYVYHTGAGVRHDVWFSSMAGVGDYANVRTLMPGDVASWTRNDGKEGAAPFTAYCDGYANQYWTDPGRSGASTGCHRNIGGRSGSQFICYPQGILGGGVTLQARQQMTFTVYNPMTGAVVLGPVTKNAGDNTTLAQGPGAYVIKGTIPTGPYCLEDFIAYPNGALVGNGGWSGNANASEIEVVDQHIRLWGGAGSRDAVKTTYCADPGTGYITVNLKIYPGTGGRTIWNWWLDDLTGKNLARWYGTANSARGRIGDTGSVTNEYTLLPSQWNTLKVKIYPAANTSQFFFNGTDIGTLSHASQGAGDILGRLRLERIDNWEAVSHFVYFDDVQVGEGGDVTPPGPVTNFAATPGNGQVVLTWTNPTSDFTGTMIRFSTIWYPGSPTGGTEIYNSNGTTFTHPGLTNGVTYYYSAFAHDAVPNYASPATVSATPSAGYCFQDLFSYNNGALVGQGGWTGNATASHVEVTGGYVRVWGGPGDYYAQKTVSCGAVGGFIWTRCLINGETGLDTMWSLRFNDSLGRNLARWYGSGTTARGRIGDTGLVTAVQNLSGAWQEIAAKINPSANTTEFFFNGVSLGTLSHASTGAGDLVQQIKMERVNNNNATSQHLYFDDLRVGG